MGSRPSVPPLESSKSRVGRAKGLLGQVYHTGSESPTRGGMQLSWLWWVPASILGRHLSAAWDEVPRW